MTGTGFLTLFDSVESLVADVRNATSIELSSQQLAKIIEEEFKAENDENPLVKKRSTKKELSKTNLLSDLISIFKWLSAFGFILLVSFIVAPESTSARIDSIPGVTTFKSTFFPPVKENLNKVDWYFYMLQLLRVATTHLKIEEKYPITDTNVENCLIDNPLYKEEKVRCSECKKTKSFGSDLENFTGHNPAVLEHQKLKQFNLGHLQQLLRENEMMLNEHTLLFKSNNRLVGRVEDIKSDEVLRQIESDDALHLEGTCVSYMSSHILRKEFPRPQIYMQDTAQNYKNYMYADGKNSPGYVLKKSLSQDLTYMYIQSSGERRLTLVPPSHCSKKCTTISRVMKEGDIAFYSSMWTAHAEPVDGKNSFSFVNTFEWVA